MRQAILDVLQVDTKIDVVLGTMGVAGPSPSGAAAAESLDEEDAPRMDDSASEEMTGADLIAKELGGVSIGEIENG